MDNDNLLADAFFRLSSNPHIQKGEPELCLQTYGIPADQITHLAQTLTHIYAQQEVPPEDAVPAAFTIGLILGLELGPSI